MIEAALGKQRRLWVLIYYLYQDIRVPLGHRLELWSPIARRALEVARNVALRPQFGIDVGEGNRFPLADFRARRAIDVGHRAPAQCFVPFSEATADAQSQCGAFIRVFRV